MAIKPVEYIFQYFIMFCGTYVANNENNSLAENKPEQIKEIKIN